MRKKFTIFLILIFILGLTPINFSKADNLSNRLKGRILLQVESKGEAWYVSPADGKRYNMGRPNDAFNLMKKISVGITNDNLNKIQIANENLTGQDSDNDGLSDMVEDSIGTDKNNKDSDSDGFNDKSEIINGYNPKGAGKITIDSNFAKQQSGKILLQVEGKGEAWYVNPNDNKRYFLGRPNDAFNLMRKLGLGITNNDLNKITDSGVPISYSGIDCGQFQISDSTESKIEKCFNDKFITCQPASVTSSVDLSPLSGLTTYYYEIIGSKNNLCEVKSKFIKNPNSAWVNKEMICQYDNSKSFELAVGDMSSCKGELYDLMTQGTQQSNNNSICTLDIGTKKIAEFQIGTTGSKLFFIASAFKGEENQISWTIKDENVAVATPVEGKSTEITGKSTGITELIVTDNSVGQNCFVSVKIRVVE